MKRVKFAGMVFEHHVSRMHNVAPITGCNRHEIYEVYGKPSKIKVSVWNEWCDWCEEMLRQGYECGIEISSHNCNYFSISGSIRTDTETYDIWITSSHNRLYQHYPL